MRRTITLCGPRYPIPRACHFAAPSSGQHKAAASAACRTVSLPDTELMATLPRAITLCTHTGERKLSVCFATGRLSGPDGLACEFDEISTTRGGGLRAHGRTLTGDLWTLGIEPAREGATSTPRVCFSIPRATFTGLRVEELEPKLNSDVTVVKHYQHGRAADDKNGDTRSETELPRDKTSSAARSDHNSEYDDLMTRYGLGLYCAALAGVVFALYSLFGKKRRRDYRYY